jgi:hypothetical protein
MKMIEEREVGRACKGIWEQGKAYRTLLGKPERKH